MRIWRLLFAIGMLAYCYVEVQPHAGPPPPSNADVVGVGVLFSRERQPC